MFHFLPDSALADVNLAEAAGQLGKMVDHRNHSQPNPGLSSLGTPCTYLVCRDDDVVGWAVGHGDDGLHVELLGGVEQRRVAGPAVKSDNY